MEPILRGALRPQPQRPDAPWATCFPPSLAWLSVRRAGGVMVLRMEDLDPDRCRPEYARQLADDLRWLGLDWDEGWQKGGPHGPYLQSERTERYEAASGPWRGRACSTPATAPGRSGWRPAPPTAPTGRLSTPAGAAI